MTAPDSSPAFGEADLSNCEREQIHLAGSIQPHGTLMLVREPDLLVVQASANAAAVLGVHGACVGCRLDDIPGDLGGQVREYLTDSLRDLAPAVRVHVGRPPRAFDAMIHRPAGGGVIVELEPAGPPLDIDGVQPALQAIVSAPTLPILVDEAARRFKALTGYDRVMIYRFDDHGHGEVFAEEREPALEPYLANRYPSSDIPQMARRLYERNRVRVLADVEYIPVPLEPRFSPLSGADLDMSLCFLRSISPIHIQYLKNMGVRATLVVSLMVEGKLWGLVACHHYRPRTLAFAHRAACEVLAEAVATRIAALESFAHAQAELSVRQLERRMIQAITREGDWRAALFDSSATLLDVVNASGAALLLDGDVRTVGDVPSTQTMRGIGRWLDEQPRNVPVAVSSLRSVVPHFADLTPIASGLLAVPVSTMPGEYLVWLRPERVRTVTWGGDPSKPAEVGDDPRTLSPRRSFAKWYEVVEGTAEPWLATDISAARLTGDTVSDVIVQFRAVRMLIAQDQLDQVRGQVQQTDQPVLVADGAGRVLHVNQALAALIAPGPKVEQIGQLARRLVQPADAQRRLAELMKERRAWRGEVVLQHQDGTCIPLLVRADPVAATSGRLLGFVLLFTDLTEMKAADAARQRFQEAIIGEGRPTLQPPNTRDELVFRKILMTIVENAQLAALEITDGSETGRLPQMLESVRRSVERTAQVLRHLLRHVASKHGEP